MTEELHSIIAVYPNHPLAELDRSRLSEEGVESWILSDDCADQIGGQTFVSGVRLLVAKEDEEEAHEILGR
jgi:hypothetical protein